MNLIMSYSNVILLNASIESFIIVWVVLHHYWTGVDPLLDDMEMTKVEIKMEI